MANYTVIPKAAGEVVALRRPGGDFVESRIFRTQADFLIKAGQNSSNRVDQIDLALDEGKSLEVTF